MNVLHCPIIALYQPYLYVKGLRDLGVAADYMVHDCFPTQAVFGRGYDYNLDLYNTLTNYGRQAQRSRELDFFHYAVEHYDVFHFHSAYGMLYSYDTKMWGRLSELKYLKSLGKKLVMSWWGSCELRTEPNDRSFKWCECQGCLPEVMETTCRHSDRPAWLEKAHKYIDIHLSNSDVCDTYPKVIWMDNAIDCEEFKPLSLSQIPTEYLLPPTDNIRIYHSFGNSTVRGDVKGTAYIKAAVEQLQKEGYKVEFIFFDNVPNRYMKYYQAQADIVADQLLCGWHGSTGVECMAMGKPVIVFIRPEVEALVPHEHPLINANPETFYYVLKDLLDNPEKIKKIGKASREYSMKYHDYRVIARNLRSIYEKI